MKNRLEIAYKLLSEDGVIFVSINDNEYAYLKVLMDEIFHNSNFIATVIHVVKPEGRRYGFIAQAHEYSLVLWVKIKSNTVMSLSMTKFPNKQTSIPR